jgi:hypothetical protein
VRKKWAVFEGGRATPVSLTLQMLNTRWKVTLIKYVNHVNNLAYNCDADSSCLLV